MMIVKQENSFFSIFAFIKLITKNIISQNHEQIIY